MCKLALKKVFLFNFICTRRLTISFFFFVLECNTCYNLILFKCKDKSLHFYMLSVGKSLFLIILYTEHLVLYCVQIIDQ